MTDFPYLQRNQCVHANLGYKKEKGENSQIFIFFNFLNKGTVNCVIATHCGLSCAVLAFEKDIVIQNKINDVAIDNTF